jgi:methylated-DNA-[protein]-cysteine S-methyltransferase
MLRPFTDNLPSPDSVIINDKKQVVIKGRVRVKEPMYHTSITTPAGTLLMTADDTAVTSMYWQVFKHTPPIQPDWKEDKKPFVQVLKQLEEYFARKRQTFDFSRRVVSGTPFQRQVWEELSKIPFGKTVTYGDIAAKVGRPTAVRAVGTAVGRNPFSIVVPCHRVLAAGGRINGYAGGLDSKATLLKIEGIPYIG